MVLFTIRRIEPWENCFLYELGVYAEKAEEEKR